jgi:hypothetical protein
MLVIMTIVPNISVEIEEKKDGYLTKQELLSLYGKAGIYVHRGVLNKIESRPPYTTVDLSEIVRYTQRIITLLNASNYLTRQQTTFSCYSQECRRSRPGAGSLRAGTLAPVITPNTFFNGPILTTMPFLNSDSIARSVKSLILSFPSRFRHALKLSVQQEKPGSVELVDLP